MRSRFSACTRLHRARRLEPRDHRPRPGSPAGFDIASRGRCIREPGQGAACDVRLCRRDCGLRRGAVAATWGSSPEHPCVRACRARTRLHGTRRLEPRGRRPRPGAPAGCDIAGRGWAFTTRATARYQMSDFAGAIADRDAALEVDPRDEQALTNPGVRPCRTRDGLFDRRCRLPCRMRSWSTSPAARPAHAARSVKSGSPSRERLDRKGPQRVIAALIASARASFRSCSTSAERSNFHSAMSIGKLLRERGLSDRWPDAGRRL